MSTEALVPATPNGLAAYVAPQGVGFEDTVLRPVHLDLVQRSSRGKGTPGQFRERANPEATYNEMKVVFLRKAREGRVLFPAGSDLGSAPLCRSNDGIVPVTTDDRLQPQAPKCDGCPQSSWKKWNKTKSSEDIPPCSNNLSLLCVDRDIKWPFFIQLSGKSISTKVPKGVVTYPMLMQNLARASAKFKMENKTSPNIFDFTATMYAAEIEGAKGSYFVVAFRDVKLLKPEDRPEFGELYEQYVAQQGAVEAAADANGEVDAEISEEKSSGKEPFSPQPTDDDGGQEYEV